MNLMSQIYQRKTFGSEDVSSLEDKLFKILQYNIAKT